MIHDLSDSELRARLEQRGVEPVRAAWMTEHRDDEDMGPLIEAVLGE